MLQLYIYLSLVVRLHFHIAIRYIQVAVMFVYYIPHFRLLTSFVRFTFATVPTSATRYITMYIINKLPIF